MNEQVKDKWVAALKSGKYKQARGYLKTENGYCCLGVLCELFIAESNELNVGGYDHITTYNRECAYLPAEVLRWADMRYVNGRASGLISSVSFVNDNADDFTSSIEYIEQNWENM